MQKNNCRQSPKYFVLLSLVAILLCLAPLSAPAFAQSDKPIRIVTPLFPSLGTGNPYQALRLPTILPTLAVFDPLTVIGRDGTIKPWLAASWSTDDSLTWTVNLREGVLFSNGEPLTSEALLVSHDHMTTPEGFIETVGSNLANIKEVRAVTDLTVEIELKEPDAFFPIRMALWKIPEPKSWKAANPMTYTEVLSGTGPFMTTKASPNELVMVPNPLAWNPPQLSGITFTLLPDQLARVQAMTSGAAEIAMLLGLSDRPSIDAIGGRLVNRPSALVQYVAFAKEHFDETPIADVRIRKALNYAVNKDAIINIIFENEVAAAGQLLQPGVPGYAPDIEPYPFDPDRARALLAEAGFPDGLDLSIRMAPRSPDDAVVYQQIANDLGKVGVNITLQQAQSTSMTIMLFDGDFKGSEMFSMASRGSDSLGDYRIRACLGLTGKNKPFFCTQETMDIYMQARKASQFDEAVALVQQGMRLEHENPPGIFLWSALELDAFAASVAEGADYAAYYDFIPLHQLSRQD